MRSLLVTGASGLLGGQICQDLSAQWQLWGTYHRQTVAYPSVTTQPMDITSEQSIQTVWEQVQPDAVIHTVALSQVGQCQRFPEHSYQVNVAGTLALARRCAAAQVPFMFTSTDLVFDGTSPRYGESDRSNPINVYGKHKAIAETELLNLYPAATICRLPLMVGAATATAQSFVQPLLAAIAAGQSQTLFTDEWRTPAVVADVTQGLALALTKGVTGIIHLGGRERLNRYELGLLVAQSFGVSTAMLRPGLQSSVKLSTPRPQDVSLNSDRAFALGYAPQTMSAALEAIAAST
ncbi:MAG: SDR family oxidoreductase [Leptolyngbyaceae cyanobacterium]